MGQKNNN